MDDLVHWWDRLSPGAQEAVLHSEYVESGTTAAELRELLAGGDVPLRLVEEKVKPFAERVEDRLALRREDGRRQEALKPAGQPLTDREREASRLCAKGMSNKNIAREMGVSQRRVDALLASVRHKTDGAESQRPREVAARRYRDEYG